MLTRLLNPVYYWLLIDWLLTDTERFVINFANINGINWPVLIAEQFKNDGKGHSRKSKNANMTVGILRVMLHLPQKHK